MYQRSVDVMIGYPFNIASYALLNHIICKVTGYKVGKLYLTLGDTHIYEQHIDKVDLQYNRQPLVFPKLDIKGDIDPKSSSTDDKIKFIENLKSEDIVLTDYYYHQPIKMDMIA
jgi:thymidylate synthase